MIWSDSALPWQEVVSGKGASQAGRRQKAGALQAARRLHAAPRRAAPRRGAAPSGCSSACAHLWLRGDAWSPALASAAPSRSSAP